MPGKQMLGSPNDGAPECRGPNVCVPSTPPGSHVEILMPNVMVAAGAPFQRRLHHEDGTIT